MFLLSRLFLSFLSAHFHLSLFGRLDKKRTSSTTTRTTTAATTAATTLSTVFSLFSSFFPPFFLLFSSFVLPSWYCQPSSLPPPRLPDEVSFEYREDEQLNQSDEYQRSLPERERLLCSLKPPRADRLSPSVSACVLAIHPRPCGVSIALYRHAFSEA